MPSLTVLMGGFSSGSWTAFAEVASATAAAFDGVVTATVGGTFDSGMTYTDVIWPTGAGWTSGSTATARANINALIASSGNGSSTTNHVRHLPAPGFTYTVDTYINILNSNHVTFELGGTEIGSSPWGHTGGATIVTQSNPDSSGDTSTKACFSAGQGGSVARFNDIRWHAGTLQGSGSLLATGSAGTFGGYQYLISSFGGDNGLVDHMIFRQSGGDCIEFQQSGGTSGTVSHQSTGWEVRYSQLLACNRMNIASQAGKNIWVHHNYFADPAYSYFDWEPDGSYQRNENHIFDHNVLAGKWAWTTSGGPSGLGFDTAALKLTIPGAQTGHMDGYFRVRNNIVTGTNNSTNYACKRFLDTASFQLHGEVTVTGNTRVGNTQTGPIASIASVTTGPFIVSSNTGFMSSGTWLQSSGVTPTQSGNT